MTKYAADYSRNSSIDAGTWEYPLCKIRLLLLHAVEQLTLTQLARPSRTRRKPKQQVLAYSATSDERDGATEAITLLMEKTHCAAHGLRNLINYRLRILLVADGSRALDDNDQPSSISKSRQLGDTAMLTRVDGNARDRA